MNGNMNALMSGGSGDSMSSLTSGFAQTMNDAMKAGLLNLQNNINTLDMHSGNTANFNTAEGDGWNVNNLIRQGGSTMNFGSDMTNSDKTTIENQAMNGNMNALMSGGSGDSMSSLTSGFAQTINDAMKNGLLLVI